MPRRSALLLASAAAAALAVLGVGPASPRAASPFTRPVVLAAGPIVVPSDRVGGGFRRVTFSPDGDGRHDVVTIRVRVRPGDGLSLSVRPDSRSAGAVALPTPHTAVTTVTWDGFQPGGGRYPDGSYVIRVCDTTTNRCSRTGVLAHLRLLTDSTRTATAVSAGTTIPVDIASDRAGPYRLDLVSAADASGEGLGGVDVPSAGRVDYRIPAVPYGGLWLLRVRSGDVVSHFPLVVHQPGMALDDPAPHTALVVYPWLTWRAYDMVDLNRDGRVDSWYAHPRDPVVPLYGPFEPWTTDPVLTGREANPESQDAFAGWLLAHKLTAQHVTDVELGRMPPSTLRKYAFVVFEGHTEYYELGTYEKLLRYRNGGGRLYFFQGNPFYGQAQIRGANVVRLSYRYRTPERSDFEIAANGFRECCWPATIRPVYHLAPGAVEALPWAFAGTGLKDGDAFGVAAGEVDTVDPQLSPRDTLVLAAATVPAFTPTSEKEAEGWIGTKPVPYPPAWKQPRRITIVYARAGKGEVFSWGNTGFLKTVRLPGFGVPPAEQAALDRVALDVWEHFAR